MSRLKTLYAALAVADTVLAAAGRDRQRRVIKPLLMPTLLVGAPRPTQRALALGGLGDVAFLGKSDPALLAGLGSFLLGHLAWIAALRPQSTRVLRRSPVKATPYLAAWVGLNAYLWPRAGRDRLPVLVYSTALLGTALVALDTGDAQITAGGVLFLTSDTLLALEKFGHLELPLHEGLVMATYTGAQALLSR